MKAGTFQQFQKEVSFLSIKFGQVLIVGFFFHELSIGLLKRMIAGKDHELVYFPEFASEGFRSDAITELPAGGVISFSKGENHKAPLHQLWESQDALMLETIKYDMLIHLITNDQNISPPRDFFQLHHIECIHGGASRIMWSIDYDQAGMVSNSFLYLIPWN